MNEFSKGVLQAIGESGEQHNFQLYSVQQSFPENWKGVYVFVQHNGNNGKTLYVGKSDKFNDCFYNHKFLGKAIRSGADSIGILIKENEQEASKILKDLIKGLKPYLNSEIIP